MQPGCTAAGTVRAIRGLRNEAKKSVASFAAADSAGQFFIVRMGSEAKQMVVRRDLRKVHDLSGGGQKPACGIALWQRELLGDQHDFVGERRFPQRRWYGVKTSRRAGFF